MSSQRERQRQRPRAKHLLRKMMPSCDFLGHVAHIPCVHIVFWPMDAMPCSSIVLSNYIYFILQIILQEVFTYPLRTLILEWVANSALCLVMFNTMNCCCDNGDNFTCRLPATQLVGGFQHLKRQKNSVDRGTSELEVFILLCQLARSPGVG